jgi:hypothetical protein
VLYRLPAQVGISVFDSPRSTGCAKTTREFAEMNFKIKIVTGPMPWPFSWGPFKRHRAFILRSNDFAIKVWQRNKAEAGRFTHDPIELECRSYPLETETACSIPACGSKRSVSASRRTKI